MAAVNAMHIIARQAVSSAASTISSTLPSAIPSSTTASNEPAMTQPSPTVTLTPASPTPTGDTGSVTQSPLLFFVALGFGVVFTNLWIIVGVKYCFRYNARNRALAMAANGQNGDIDLQNVTPAPRRRRRERKLLSMEEVNRQFPLQKYGAWIRSREAAGLPAEGGVDGANAAAVVSRAQSLRNADGVIEAVPTSPVTAKHSMDKSDSKMETTEITVAPASPTTQRQSIDITTAKEKAPAVTQTLESHERASDPHILSKYQTNNTTATLDSKNPDADRHSDAESEDEDAIHAIHPDVTDVPGDSCAICIDDLEEDEDIRGLTCGHAFHASCIDPWLTTRRACCPLCKRDYWVPKPRAEGETEETSEQRRQRRREREERRAAREANTVWAVRGTRIYLPGRFLGGGPVYVGGGDRFGSHFPSAEMRRRERAEMERQQRRIEERMAATQQRRALREQARRERADARAAGGGSGWRAVLPFGRRGQQDAEAQERARPQNAAEAQLMAQARGQTGQQQSGGGVIARLNPFGRSCGAGNNAIGAGPAESAQAAQPTPGQVEAQAETPATGRRGWRFR